MNVANTSGRRWWKEIAGKGIVPIVLLLSPLFIACGDSSHNYALNGNAYGGGGERTQNFAGISLSSFNGFSEIAYDSTIIAGFLGTPLAVANNQFAVVTTSRQLAMIRFNKILWTYQFPENSFPLPELTSDSLGTIYISTTEGRLYAVDSSGSLQWEESLLEESAEKGYSIPVWPLVVPGGVVAGMTNGALKRFDREGKLVWKKAFVGLTRSVAFREEFGLAVGVSHNDYKQADTLVLLDEKGEEKWRVEVGGRIEYGPMIVGEHLVLGIAHKGEEGKYLSSVIWFDREGNREWAASLPTLPTGMAADGEGNIYVCGGGGSRMSGGTITSFDSKGKERWEVGLRQSVPTSPIVGGDMLCFLGTQEKAVGAFLYGRDGTFLKFAPVESPAEITLPPTLLPDGYLVISCSSKPIILKSRAKGLFGL